LAPRSPLDVCCGCSACELGRRCCERSRPRNREDPQLFARQILVDAKGRTLYLFEKDKSGKSACYGQCTKYWPPLLTIGKPTAAAGVKASLLGTTRRTNGAMQVTYAHHPLYRYAGDTAPGQTTGQGSDNFGAEWYVVAPSGKKIDED